MRGVRRATLRGRVALVALAAIAVWLVMLTVALNVVIRIEVNRNIDDRLEVRAQAASATVEVSGGRIVRVPPPAIDRLDSSVWVYSHGRALARPPAEPPLQRFADRLAGAPRGLAAGGVDDGRFFVLPVLDGTRRIGTVVTAISTEPAERASSIALRGSIVAALLLLAGAYPVVRFATGRALRPVDRMSRRAARWSVSEPGRRFGDEQRFDELNRLARNLDGLLDRVSGVLRHERSMSAELSHELRTPLARIVAESELLARTGTPDPATVQALDGIAEAARTMETIIDTLLTTSRVDHATAHGRCDVAQVVRTLADGARHDTGSATVTEVVPADLYAGVDQAVAERVVAPLVDNAVRYGRARIDLHAWADGASVVVEVRSDGSRIDDLDRERIFEPGYRASDDDVGTGLGLALARRLARAADGDVVLADTDPPAFRVILPRG